MNAARLWMIGCIVFAALSAWLAIFSTNSGLNQYTGDLHGRFIRDQRDTMFKLISKAQPPLTVEQIESAAQAYNLRFEKKATSIKFGNGIEFVVSGSTIANVRSTNF
ncbi:MAG TPA: hypothetical protein VF467_15750 [Afipia sp.]